MVTKEEIAEFDITNNEKVKNAQRVTAAELSHFVDDNATLAKMIADRKKQYERDFGVKSTPAYDDIEEICLIGASTYKKAMCNQRKITRTFLYKLAVGFKMSIDEANKYFELCGGPLSRNKIEDYICLNALRDGDDIYQLVEDFEKHLNLKIGL